MNSREKNKAIYRRASEFEHWFKILDDTQILKKDHFMATMFFHVLNVGCTMSFFIDNIIYVSQ